MVPYKALAQNWHAVTSTHIPEHHMAKARLKGMGKCTPQRVGKGPWKDQKEREDFRQIMKSTTLLPVVRVQRLYKVS